MLTEPSIRSRTLVVDDDEVMRELLAELLTLHGHAVHAAASGEAAIAWLGTEPSPDLVLTDLHMPGMEGLTLVQALRGATDKATQLLGMSGKQPVQAVLDDLDGFVLKPFAYAELQAAIDAFRAPAASGTAGKLQAPPAPATGAAAPMLDESIFAALRESFRPAQLAELYTMTLNDVSARGTRMQILMDAGDIEALHREAHSIKGLCGMVGAAELSALAGAAETGTVIDPFLVRDLSAACVRLRRMLDTKFGNQIAPAGEHE